MDKYCYPSNPVRLACLIHAASVRSEPESNSQKKEFESSSHKHLLFSQTSVVKERRSFPQSGERVHSISYFPVRAQGEFYTKPKIICYLKEIDLIGAFLVMFNPRKIPRPTPSTHALRRGYPSDGRQTAFLTVRLAVSHAPPATLRAKQISSLPSNFLSKGT